MKVRWRAWCLLALLTLHCVVANPLTRRRSRRQSLPEQDGLELANQPLIYSEEMFGPDLLDRGPRDKRKINILLNILFWKINTLLDLKTRLLGRISERQRLGGRFFSTTTAKPEDDDTPEFDSNRVMLDIPGELFGTAFSVVTDVSKIVGDVILNSARRTQKFIEGLKPAIARTLGYKITSLTSSSSISKSTGEDEDSSSANNDANSDS